MEETMFVIDAEKFDKMVDDTLTNDEKYCEQLKILIANINLKGSDDIRSLLYPVELRISEIIFEKGFHYGINFIISNIKNSIP